MGPSEARRILGQIVAVLGQPLKAGALDDRPRYRHLLRLAQLQGLQGRVRALDEAHAALFKPMP
jgi:hypothetical protein